MCGIVGMFNANDEHALNAMLESTVHRGEDSTRYEFHDERCGIGINRLSIVDLERGEQPLRNESGDVRVVCNGEIYNHEAIAADLSEHELLTRSDAEVISHLYEDHGEDCVNLLDGMFAFVLYDRKKQTFLAARDPIGKSTFIRAISAATPRVADYPFTTLYPNLGVVRIEQHRSFVVADIPGLIEGAAEGAGLGALFLKHVQRNRLLLHVVDVAPMDGSDPVEQVRAIEQELAKFDPELVERPRWLLLNKLDLLPEEERQATIDRIIGGLDWKAPWFPISAISREGTEIVTLRVMEFLDQLRADALAQAGESAAEAEHRAWREQGGLEGDPV